MLSLPLLRPHEPVLPELDLPALEDDADLVGSDPKEAHYVHFCANNYLLDQDPSPVRPIVEEDHLLAVDCAVDCQHARFQIVAEVEDLSTLTVHSLRQVKFTASQAVPLPENDLRVELSIDLAPSLETSDKTAIRHETDGQFQSRDWGL